MEAAGAVSLVFSLIYYVIQIFCYAILIRMIISFFPDLASNKWVMVLYEITDPIIKPFRRLKIGGSKTNLDFAPLLAILALWLVQIFCIKPFM